MVNAICPGAIVTERTNNIVKSLYKNESTLNKAIKKYVQEYGDDTPLGRLCTTEDVSNLAVFYAQKESDFITGKSITLDGGKNTD